MFALVLACTATLALPVTPAEAQSGPIGRLLVLVNQDRARSGIGPVALNSTLNGIAQAHAQAMAAARRIYQNPAFPGNIPGAMAAGENVGYGPDADSVSAAFEASPEHQVNIVNPHYAAVGLGVANSPIGLMVVEEFADHATGGAAPEPAPAPVPAPAPAPVKPVVAKPPPPPPPPPTPVAAPPPPPPPPPLPPPPPTIDLALYARMLQWALWQAWDGSPAAH